MVLTPASALLDDQLLNGALDINNAALRAGDRAAHNDHVELGIDLDHVEVLDGDLTTPMWPACFLPGKIREGSVLEPMEPA